MNCLRCGRAIGSDISSAAVICGNCADDLRQEIEAMKAEVANAEAIADQMNRDAYEETLQRGESEYRHI